MNSVAPLFWRIADSTRFLPIVVVSGLLLRLALLVFFPSGYFSDAIWYVDRGLELADGLGLQEDGYPTASWAVGWPAMLAVVYKITGSMRVSHDILNLSAAAATLFLILWLGRRVLSERCARVAVLIYAFYPAHIAYTGVAFTEIFHAALFMVAFCLFIANHHKLSMVALAGVVFGLATLFKPQTYLFPIGMIFAAWVIYRQTDWKRGLLTTLVLYGCLFAVVLPWSIRNQQVLGEFVLVASNGGSVLYYGANPEMTGQYIELKSLYPKLGLQWENRVRNQVADDKAFRTAALTYIRENPWTYISWMPTKLAMFWMKDADGFWTLERTYPDATVSMLSVKVVNQVYYLVILILSLPFIWSAIVGLWRRQEPQSHQCMLLLTPVFVSLLAMVLTGLTRYHFIAMPFLALAAGWTITRYVGPGESGPRKSG